MPALKNPRHERFAQELAKGQTQEEAYAEAGYSDNKSAASRLGNDVNICERVASIQERGAVRAEITIGELTADLLRYRDLLADTAVMTHTSDSGEDEIHIVSHQHLSAARQCVMDAAKLNGLIVEKTENTNKQVDNLTDEDLADIARAGSTGTDKKKGGSKESNIVH